MGEIGSEGRVGERRRTYEVDLGGSRWERERERSLRCGVEDEEVEIWCNTRERERENTGERKKR